MSPVAVAAPDTSIWAAVPALACTAPGPPVLLDLTAKITAMATAITPRMMAHLHRRSPPTSTASGGGLSTARAALAASSAPGSSSRYRSHPAIRPALLAGKRSVGGPEDMLSQIP